MTEMQYLKSSVELQKISFRCIDRFNNKEIDIYDVVSTITLAAFKKGLKQVFMIGESGNECIRSL